MISRIPRECRHHSQIPHRKPIDILFPTGDFPRVSTLIPRDIVKQNIRESRLLQPRRDIVREVPPFSTQTLQRNTRAVSLPSMRQTKTAQTAPEHKQCDEWGRFRVLYERNELPVRIVHGVAGEKAKALRWLVDSRSLKPEHIAALIPMFACGIPLVDQPYRFIAERGLNDLLDLEFHPAILIHCLPQLVRACRAALYSFDIEKKKEVLSLISRITRRDVCGPALVPFYRQLLPPLRSTSHGGLRMDVRYAPGRPLDEMIELTLNELERTGGPNAFINIKYIIPTYTSVTDAM